MIEMQVFVFSGFQVNTIVLFDETREAILVDPACFEQEEKEELSAYFKEKKLTLKKVIFTHCHLDHVFGAAYIRDTYPGVPFIGHKEEQSMILRATGMAKLFNVVMEEPPSLDQFIGEKDRVEWGHSSLEILHAPGHSSGSLCYVSREQKFVIAGDVLFAGGIGRTDLPGGNYEALMTSIKEKLMTLPDDFTVFSGHGPSTSIGKEKRTNYFLTGN